MGVMEVVMGATGVGVMEVGVMEVEVEVMMVEEEGETSKLAEEKRQRVRTKAEKGGGK